MEPTSSEAKVTNVQFQVIGLTVKVKYNLIGDSEAEYHVALILKKASDPSFLYLPKELSGDIGYGRYSGNDKEIVWDLRDEFPRGLSGNDFYFVVKAEEVERHQSVGFLTWLGGGVAVVAGVVTYFLVNQNRGGQSVAPAFPDPPGRPK